MHVKGRIVADWIFGGEFLVEVDPKPGFFVAPQHPILEFWTTWKNFFRSVIESAEFLDSEIGRGEVEVNMRGVANG